MCNARFYKQNSLFLMEYLIKNIFHEFHFSLLGLRRSCHSDTFFCDGNNLTLSMLSKLSADDSYFSFFPENSLSYIMQTVSLGDILLDMPKPVFWRKYKKKKTNKKTSPVCRLVDLHRGW